jgi:hypothetical protein
MEENAFSPSVALLLAVLGGFTNALKAYTGIGCLSLPSPSFPTPLPFSVKPRAYAEVH